MEKLKSKKVLWKGNFQCTYKFENPDKGEGHIPMFKYNLDFPGLMKNMSYIIKKYRERNEIPLR